MEMEKKMDETEIRHRCFMDGIHWQHHLEADASGTPLFCISVASAFT